MVVPSVTSPVEYTPTAAPHRPALNSRRVRRSVGNGATTAIEVSYDTSRPLKFRVRGEAPIYLTVLQNRLTVGPDVSGDAALSHVYFRIHHFDMLTASDGQGVVLEAPRGGTFLWGAASGTLNLQAGRLTDVTGLEFSDDRFFQIITGAGDRYSKIKHLHSGLYLSVAQDGTTSLVSHVNGFQDGMLFEQYPYSHS